MRQDGTADDLGVIDLIGQVCPYPVVNIIREAEQLAPGQSVRFLVDDPLAIKSVPEELEEMALFTLETRRCDACWEITVSRI